MVDACWQTLDAEGIPGRWVRSRPSSWLASHRHCKVCDHAGLLLLFPAIAQLGLNDLVRQASVITRVPGSTCR